MSIIVTTDITNNLNPQKEKKLNLSVSKEQFCNSMIFDSDEEQKECERYLNLKGISYHARLANYIGFDKDGKVNYEKVAILYKYDKRIRNLLYKFLAALEEQIRAYISNHFSGHKHETKWLYRKIKKEIHNGSSLSKELENLSFSELLNLSKRMPKQSIHELYQVDKNHLEDNLNAVRELRNAVSHHRVLLLYDNFEFCYVDGQKDNTLICNIKNLQNLLNPYYQEPMKKRINESSNDSNDFNFEKKLPIKAILKIN